MSDPSVGEVEAAPRSPRNRTTGCVALALFVLVSVIVTWRAGTALYDRLRPHTAAEAAPIKVEVVRLQPEPFERTVGAAGSLEPIHSVDVFPKVGGRVVRLHVGLGDHVRAGDPLASVESPEYALMVDKAEEGVEITSEAAAVAEKSLARLDEVRGKLGEGALSEQDYDKARVEVEGARTQADVARLDAALARQMVRNATMTAPVDGIVSKVDARVGGMIGERVPAFHVVDASRLVLRCEVGDLDLPLVAVGQVVRATSDALPGVALTGTVTAVSPALDAWTRRAPVEISFENADGAVPGNVFARAAIVVEQDPAATLVPLAAVADVGGVSQVQVVRDGRVATVPVEVWGQAGDRVAIRGVERGEDVVLPGAAHLADGEVVSAVPVGGGAP